MKNEIAVIDNKPGELIRFAIEKGTNLVDLEKLLALQERFEANEAKKAYNKAMSAFKADPPKIDKDKKVGYDSKQGGRVGYKHASLYNVTQKISSKLSIHGLSAQWKTNQVGKEISVTTTITHELGHSESTVLTAEADLTGSKNPIQAIGSTVTYLQRYGLLALTGLATFEQDDDGIGTVTNFISPDQIIEVTDLISEKDADIQKFLAFMKIDSIDKMPVSKYQQAINALKSKKGKK